MMARVKAYQRRRLIVFTAACVVSVVSAITVTPALPTYIGEAWDGIFLVFAALLWVAFFGVNSHYQVASELQLRLDRLQDELEEKIDEKCDQVGLMKAALQQVELRSADNQRRIDTMDDASDDHHGAPRQRTDGS